MKWTAWSTLIALLVYVWISLNVVKARIRHKIQAPVMDGPIEFQSVLRVQANARPDAGGLRLALGSPAGGQMSPERLARREVWIAPRLNAPAGEWTLLPNALVLINGQLELRDAGAAGAVGGRFYKLIER